MRWAQLSRAKWVLVDSDDRILDEVSGGLDFTYTVASTGYRYVTLEQAQRAAEAKVTP